MLKRMIVGRWVARMREEKKRGGGSSRRCCGRRKVVGADGMARRYCEKNRVGRIGYAGEENYSRVDAFLRTCLRVTVLECHVLLELAAFARHVLALDGRVLVSSQRPSQVMYLLVSIQTLHGHVLVSSRALVGHVLVRLQVFERHVPAASGPQKSRSGFGCAEEFLCPGRGAHTRVVEVCCHRSCTGRRG